MTSTATVWTDATRAQQLPGTIDGNGDFDFDRDEPLVDLPLMDWGFTRMFTYLDLWPRADASSVDRGDGTARKVISNSRSTDEDFYQLRVDHNLSDSDSIFGRFTRQTSVRITPPTFFWSREDFNPNFFLTVEEKKIFSPQLLNTFRAAFNRRGAGQNSFEEGLPAGLDVLKFVPEDQWQSPLGAGWTQGSISGTGASTVGVGRGWVDRKINRFQWADDVIWNRGNHSWKFGFDWQRLQHNGVNPSRPAGAYSMRSFDRFLIDGEVNRFRGDISPNSNGQRGLRWDIVGWYVQGRLANDSQP